MSRREVVTSAAHRLGLLPLLERVPAKPMLAVVVYHRIMKFEDSRHDPNVIEATPDEFDDHMTMLKKRHAVIDPDELAFMIDNPKRIKRLHVAITFDDGYRDNYDNAFPILKSHGLRATFFLPTHFIGTSYLTWWDQIGWMIRRTEKNTFDLRGKTFRLDERDVKLVIRDVLRLLKSSNDDLGSFLVEVAAATGVEPPTSADDRQFMSWEEAEEMEKAGMGIASHTHTHKILAALAPEEQVSECQKARDILKDKGYRLADSLAYPVGDRDAFTATTVNAARDVGYRFGFSNFGGLNEPDSLDRYNVRRVGVDQSADSALQLRFRLAWARRTAKEPW